VTDFLLTDEGELDTDGGLTLVTGVLATAQKIVIRLRFFKGEWFLDLDTGLDYIGVILRKGTPLPLIASLYREALAETPGVESVISLDLEFDRPTRNLRVFGSCVHAGLDEPINFDVRFVVGD